MEVCPYLTAQGYSLGGKERYTWHAVQSGKVQVTASSEAIAANWSNILELKTLVLKQQAQLE